MKVDKQFLDKFAIFFRDNYLFADINYDTLIIFASEEFSPVFNTPDLIFLELLKKIEKEVEKYEDY
jgi:hypothetical protein